MTLNDMPQIREWTKNMNERNDRKRNSKEKIILQFPCVSKAARNSLNDVKTLENGILIKVIHVINDNTIFYLRTDNSNNIVIQFTLSFFHFCFISNHQNLFIFFLSSGEFCRRRRFLFINQFCWTVSSFLGSLLKEYFLLFFLYFKFSILLCSSITQLTRCHTRKCMYGTGIEKTTKAQNEN